MASNGGGGQGNEKGKRPASGMGACSAVVTSEKFAKRNSSTVSDQLSCPVCKEDLKPPIFQCTHGHCVCNDCIAKIRAQQKQENNTIPCPTCRIPMNPALMVRNRTAEGICEALRVPCSFGPFGCRKEDLPFLERHKHEASCDYNPEQPCPFSDLCTWKGTHIDMLGHSDSTTRKPHRSIIKLSELVVNREARLAMLLDPRNSQDPTKFDTKLYLLKDVHASSVVHVLFMRRWVQSMKAHAAFLKFVGPSTERNNYYCEITYGVNPMNQQIWKGPIYSAKDRNADICDGRRCMLVPDKVVRDLKLDAAAGPADAEAAAAGAIGDTFLFSFVVHKKPTFSGIGGLSSLRSSMLYGIAGSGGGNSNGSGRLAGSMAGGVVSAGAGLGAAAAAAGAGAGAGAGAAGSTGMGCVVNAVNGCCLSGHAAHT